VVALASYAHLVTDRVHPSFDATTIALPEMLAAIDIGTNSLHMVVARMSGDGRFEVVTRHKEVVRLGETGDLQLRHLTPEAIDRGVAALVRCRAILDSFNVEVSAVATSAVREAENAAEFIRRAWDEARIEVEVIGGREEARLIHLGVLQALPVYDTPLMLCDIGGGSTELLLGHHGEVFASRSFKLGAIRLSRRFFPDGTVTPKAVDKARKFIRETILPFDRSVAAGGFEIFVASSGTAENLVSIALAAGDLPAPRSLNGATLTRKALRAVVAMLIECPTSVERAKIDGLDPGRADIIVGGALILEQVMEQWKIPELTFSDAALREGVLLDLFNRLRGQRNERLSDLRRDSVEHLMEVCDDDPEHSVRVAEFAVVVFDALQEFHGFGHHERELIEAAGLLANVGLFVSHSRHHQHSYYVIRNSEHLSGFNDHEIEVIAQTARYHRRSDPTPKHAPFAELSEEDRWRVRWMAAMLRIAIGLDRSHARSVAAVEVRWTPETLTFVLTPFEGADVGMEVFAIQERSALLASLLERDVLVEAASVPSP
jgi:exopolyphosphatase/guanosine-5'-triphosphate,3'-diphosphate pyrophosphatase